MGLREFIAVPSNVREWNTWQREALTSETATSASVTAGDAAVTAAYIAADAAHVAAADPHPTYTTAAELAAATAALVASANTWALRQTFTLAPVVPSYTVAGVPSASPAAQLIYVSDESGGAVLAFSDNTNWRRVTDRAVVS